MKCFMPVYALALALAVTSDMVQQVSAAACVEATVCAPAASCTNVPDGTTTAATVERPAVEVLPTCPTGTFAYIKSLVIVPGTGTTASDIKVRISTTAAAVLATATPATPDVTPACDSTYSNLGSDATADVKASIGCASGTCAFKYKATYACQPDSCATTCTDTAKCTQKNLAKDATLELIRPATTDLAACATGKFAYLSSLEVGVTGTTKASDLTVAFSAGTTPTVLAGAKNTTECVARWADVGKTTTADMKAVVTCTATAGCDFKHKSVWACQAAAASTGGSTAGNTSNTTAPSATPTPTPKSGAAGANPVVVWGTALVAAVAGANFAAPL